MNGRRLTNSNGTSTYAPGVQRVAQSSAWYKPKIFTIKTSNGHSNEPPKPLPRYSKMSKCNLIIILALVSNKTILHKYELCQRCELSILTALYNPIDQICFRLL
jgi:hypothetical protein